MQHANRSRHDEHVEVVFSEWKSAPIVLGNETVFGVGDVHGCARELNALLGAIAGIKTDSDCGRRLVFLGDLIDRGPDNIRTLNLWAEGEAARGVDRIDRLMGTSRFPPSSLPAALFASWRRIVRSRPALPKRRALTVFGPPASNSRRSTGWPI